MLLGSRHESSARRNAGHVLCFFRLSIGVGWE
jgi:hypothetical protein